MKRCMAVVLAFPAGLLVGCANNGEIKQAEVGEIRSAQELKARLVSGDVLLIHTFDAENYAQGHIPGAVNVDMEKMKPSMLPAEKGKSMVFYCSGGGCPVSRMASEKAVGWGYQKVWVYSGGTTDWQAAGMKLEAGGK